MNDNKNIKDEMYIDIRSKSSTIIHLDRFEHRIFEINFGTSDIRLNGLKILIPYNLER